MIEEIWKPLTEFPQYAGSTTGKVMSYSTNRIKSPMVNDQGIPSVLLMKDYRQHRRAIPLLIARLFLPKPPLGREAFTSPINMDGDRLNNRIDNLEWRPLWFARKYHVQYQEPTPYGFDAPIMWIQTGETYSSVREAAKKYGLLEKEIIMSVENGTPVFPTWQSFCLVE